MKIHEENIKVTRTARYFLLGDIDGPIDEVWFVCHGQGQLGGYFIKHFSSLDNGKRLIVAPEGLSRFYMDGLGGRVGAIWMTKEDRLNEIEDYVNYLDTLYAQLRARWQHRDVKIHALGFSQGVATVSRWICRGNVKADHLTLWAGLLPPELELDKLAPLFNSLKLSLVFGKQDNYADDTIIENEEGRLRKHGISYRLITFDGGHNIDANALAELVG